MIFFYCDFQFLPNKGTHKICQLSVLIYQGLPLFYIFCVVSGPSLIHIKSQHGDKERGNNGIHSVRSITGLQKFKADQKIMWPAQPPFTINGKTENSPHSCLNHAVCVTYRIDLCKDSCLSSLQIPRAQNLNLILFDCAQCLKARGGL